MDQFSWSQKHFFITPFCVHLLSLKLLMVPDPVGPALFKDLCRSRAIQLSQTHCNSNAPQACLKMQLIFLLHMFEGISVARCQDNFANLISSGYDFLEVIVHS